MRNLTEQETAVAYATLPIAEIGPWLESAFTEVSVYLERKGAGPAGLAFARYRHAGEGVVEVEAGFPASTPPAGEGNIDPSDLPGGPAASPFTSVPTTRLPLRPNCCARGCANK